MTIPPEAFRHVPHLAGKIVDPVTSFYRITEDTMHKWDVMAREAGNPDDWRIPRQDRDASRARAMAGRMDRDLWLFTYGSLMWDPAILFDEVRIATLNGFQRRFCLILKFGRGSFDKPSLMVALDQGGECHGLAFRIPAQNVKQESETVWARELIYGDYLPRFVTINTPQGEVEALTFTIDPTGERYAPDLSDQETARMIAEGGGWIGSNLEYLDNLVEHLATLGLSDPEIDALHRRARKAAAELPATPGS